ncbi:MAG: hypothetical protein CBB68_14285 [Rhodospirillaceae bacterium TMED8]|nr:hypothetical protein [Magnetovibrio sp.]OUT48125.1 MAG: hypothetical protein CBB68_14285 [Rhodospirillaceae bacterium TMED8]|tara:strand:- start:288 stop:515 length:228 start_codon:yes stop_codon:yes gene_type:complete
MTSDIVVVSTIEAPGKVHCVDVFRRPDMTYGYEHFRNDSEDKSGWFVTGNFSHLTFATEKEALADAKKRLPWLLL